jgi:hypothetical protein
MKKRLLGTRSFRSSVFFKAEAENRVFFDLYDPLKNIKGNGTSKVMALPQKGRLLLLETAFFMIDEMIRR